MANRQTYTTYLRTELDPVSRSSYQSLGQIARSTYSEIAAAAQRAGALTSQVNPRGGARGALASQAGTASANAQTSAVRALGTAQRQQADQARRSTAANDNATGAVRRATSASNSYTSSLRQESTAARIAAAENAALARSISVVGTTLNVVQGPLGPLAGRVAAVGQAVQSLTGVTLGLAGAGAAIFSFASAANRYAEIESKLRPLYEAQSDVNRAVQDSIGIANRSRSSLAATVDLYSKLTNAGRDFGLVQSQINRVTELASKAATLSGGNSQTREAGLYQFAQGLASGTLSGDELKSVKENTSELARAIAAGFKNADGSIGTTIANLKDLGAQGKLTTGIIVEALENAATKIETKFARLPVTLSTAATQFSTQFTAMIGGFDQATGTTTFLASSLLAIAENLRTITSLAVGLGAAFVVPRVAAFVTDLVAAATAQASLNAAVTAGNATLLTSEGILAAKAVTAREAARVESSAAGQRVAAIQQEIAALRAAQAQYAANLAAAERNAAASAAALKQAQFSQSIGQPAGNVGNYAAVAAADARALSAARLGLLSTTSKLATAEGALTAAQVSASGAAGRYLNAVNNADRATASLRASTGLLSGAMGLLRAAFPILAVTALVSVMFSLATAESAAARNARELADAQSTLGQFIDSTTGKIKEQNAELVRGRVESARTRKDQAFTDFQGSTQRLKEQLNPRSTGILGRGFQAGYADASPAVKSALQGFLAGQRGSYAALNAALDQMRAQGGAFERTADRISKEAQGRLSAARNTSSAIAEERLLTNKPRKGDLGQAFGADNLPPASRPSAAAVTPKSNAQLEADAKALAAMSAREKAEAALAKVRADGAAARKAGTFDQAAYTEQLNAAVLAVDAAKDAEKAASAAKRDGAKATGEAAAAEKERAREAKAAALDAAQATLDQSQQSLEERAPTLSRQQYLDERIAILETYDAEVNAVNGLAKDSNRADRQRISDAREVAAARREITTEFEREMAVSRLRIDGRDIEADALERTLQLVERIGNAGYEEYQNFVRQGIALQEVNDKLADRERIVSTLTSAVDSTRDAVEQLLVDLPNGAPKAAANFGKQLLANFRAQSARLLTNELFGGVDQKVRDLISGRAALQNNTTFAATQMQRGGTAVSSFADVVASATAKISSSVASITGIGAASVAPGAPLGSLSDFARTIADEIAEDRSNIPVESSGSNDNADIVVTARNVTLPAVTPDTTSKPAKVPTLQEVYNETGRSIGTKLDDLLGTKFFKGIGASFGNILQGAGAGGSIGSLFGGAGGSIGSLIGGAGTSIFGTGFSSALSSAAGPLALASAANSVIGDIFGFKGGPLGILTSPINNIINPSRSAGATLTGVDQFTVGGKDKKQYEVATGLAGQVSSQLQNIADQLGADLGSFNTTIGVRDGDYRVNKNGTSLKTKNGAIEFDDDSEAAIAFAIQDAIEDGALKGISAASKKILTSGQDLQKALEKATLIESIPKRLLALTDPVRYAIEELNDEFEKMIAALNEGGASAAQFADAQKLYELERAKAIEQATNGAIDAFQDFLDEMKGGSSSPLSRRTVYQNAQSDFAKLEQDVLSGKVVDQQDLLTAAQNLQNASSTLFGSSSAFFTDFNRIFDTVTKAKGNVSSGTSTADLPGSPFATAAGTTDTSTLQQIGQTQVTAVQSQTAILSAQNQQMIALMTEMVKNVYGSGSLSDSSLALLRGNFLGVATA